MNSRPTFIYIYIYLYVSCIPPIDRMRLSKALCSWFHIISKIDLKSTPEKANTMRLCLEMGGHPEDYSHHRKI